MIFWRQTRNLLQTVEKIFRDAPWWVVRTHHSLHKCPEPRNELHLLEIRPLDAVVTQRHAPLFLSLDNGPESITEVAKDWCRELDIHATYCDPGSPWQNGRIKSLTAKLRDELLTREVLDSMWEILFMLKKHRENSKHCRPHSALASMTPHEFTATWHQENKVVGS
jgi:hypothetical protein